MKVSLNLAQQYSSVDLKSIAADDILQRIGTQLGAVEDVMNWKQLYEGVVVVRVVSCEPHPNADKLKVCLVDDGGVVQHVERNQDGLIQVVCGAPNVSADMFVAWIPPEVAVPSTRLHDPFVLEVRELRGIKSNGMLASPKELEIDDDHSGLLIITPEEADREPHPGDPLETYFGLDDVVIDCENKMFTHRPDCFGNLGVAREIAGIFGLSFQSPEWYLQTPTFKTIENRYPLDVRNDIPELVPRFTIVTMDAVKVGPSPIWLKSVLKRVGIKSINNVVDITNYVMHVTGQPLHAFDYDKIAQHSDKPTLQPRKARDGESIQLLNGKTIKLTADDIVIATDKTAVAVAGVMGGSETEVDEQTTKIIIECANFDMYSVRRTSMRHGLFTDAVTRFTKGQSPLQNDRVLAFAMQQMKDLAAAEQAGDVVDIAGFDLGANNLSTVALTATFINERLGSSLQPNDIRRLLESVECVIEQQDDTIRITAPFWRMDLAIPEDIVEEIGRLVGFQTLPVNLPLRTTKPAPRSPERVYAAALRKHMLALGANEVLTYSFVHGDLMRQVNINPEESAYHIRNALSPELQYYRCSVLPSLLTKVHPNLKAQAGRTDNAFVLYEIGKAHNKNEMDLIETSLPAEFKRVAAVFAADDKSSEQQTTGYYTIKSYIDELTHYQATYQPLENNDAIITRPFQVGRSAVVSVNGQEIGVVGEFQPSVMKSLKLPKISAGFELDIEAMRQVIKKPEYKQLSSYPSSTQDLTLEVGEDVLWGMLFKFLQAELAVIAAENNYVATLEPTSLYYASDSGRYRYSFRCSLAHRSKTLQTPEVTAVLDTITRAAHEKLDSVRI